MQLVPELVDLHLEHGDAVQHERQRVVHPVDLAEQLLDALGMLGVDADVV